METQIKLCLTLPLRDYAAFEDLATELGVRIFDIEIADTQKPQPQPQPPTKYAPRRSRRVPVTRELYDAVMSYPDDMAHRAVVRQLLKKYDKVPSVSCIGRIRRGEHPMSPSMA